MEYWHYGVRYDYWKYGWGIFFGFLYVVGIIAFARNAWRSRSQEIVYNWFGVMVAFLAIGLVIYLIFIVQI